MKKLSTIFVLLLLCATVSMAQGYRKGVNNLNVGIGFGMNGIYGDATVPPVTVGLQFGIEDKISVGGIIGYSASSYDFGSWYGTDYKWTYSYIMIGVRGEYHFLEPSNQWDAYGGITLGYNIVSVSSPSGFNGYYSAGDSYMLYGFHVGARYAFSPKIGAFGELGYGMSIFTVGVNFKL